jgi:hypothetical protein
MRPSDGQPTAGLSAMRGLATLSAYLVFSVTIIDFVFLNMVCLTVALAFGREMVCLIMICVCNQQFRMRYCRRRRAVGSIYRIK